MLREQLKVQNSINNTLLFLFLKKGYIHAMYKLSWQEIIPNKKLVIVSPPAAEEGGQGARM